MKNQISLSYLILIITPLFFDCCGPEVKENENNTSESSVTLGDVVNGKYMIDTKESVVTWKGSLLFESGEHTGYVYLSKGELIFENGQLLGGTAEVDMNTIEDKDHGSDNNLVNHLKDPDFFDVKKFPTSTIKITKVASIKNEHTKVTGNLTIKGITHAVTFPAEIEVKDNIVKATGKLIIDRTKWDVRYNSGKFYYNLADNTISDAIEFNLKIIAKNKQLNP